MLNHTSTNKTSKVVPCLEISRRLSFVVRLFRLIGVEVWWEGPAANIENGPHKLVHINCHRFYFQSVAYLQLCCSGWTWSLLSLVANIAPRPQRKANMLPTPNVTGKEFPPPPTKRKQRAACMILYYATFQHIFTTKTWLLIHIFSLAGNTAIILYSAYICQLR